jgi:hypothetical protein
MKVLRIGEESNNTKNVCDNNQRGNIHVFSKTIGSSLCHFETELRTGDIVTLLLIVQERQNRLLYVYISVV